MAFLLTLFFLYWKYLATYIVGGVVYSVFKWIFQLYRLGRDVKEIGEKEIAVWRSKWSALRDRSEAEVIDSLRGKLAKKYFGQDEYPPSAKQNKGNFLMWSLFWPVNAIYTAFADVAKEAWLWIYAKIGSLLDALAKAILPK